MITDLIGSWETQSLDTIFQISRIDTEQFNVLELKTKEEYQIFLSVLKENEIGIGSNNQFWDRKFISIENEDSFILSENNILNQINSHSWFFQRVNKSE